MNAWGQLISLDVSRSSDSIQIFLLDADLPGRCQTDFQGRILDPACPSRIQRRQKAEFTRELVSPILTAETTLDLERLKRQREDFSLSLITGARKNGYIPDY